MISGEQGISFLALDEVGSNDVETLDGALGRYSAQLEGAKYSLTLLNMLEGNQDFSLLFPDIPTSI